MKKTIFKTVLASLALIMTITFYACEKDQIEIRDEQPQAKLKRASDCTFRGMKNNGKWLVFNNQEIYNNVADELRERLKRRTANGADIYLNGSDKDGYGITYDPMPELATFESCAKHQSYRKIKEILEDDQLRRGADPERITDASIDPLNITSHIVGSLTSKDGVIQIGREIYVALNRTKRVVIKNNRADIVDQLISSGKTDVLYEEGNIGDVQFANQAQGTSIVPGFICTAEFNALQGSVNEQENSATYIFQWNDGDGSGAIDLDIEWIFGDGTVINDGSTLVSYTYENLEPYPTVNKFIVCCDVSYTYLDEGDEIQTCSKSNCEEIEIVLEEEINPCDEVREALAVITATILDNVLVFSTDAGTGEVCVGLGDISGAISNLANITYEWSINGEDITGGNPCFDVTCDGNYTGTLTIFRDEVACYVNSFTYDYSGGDANCQGHNDIPKKDVVTWSSDSDRKTKFRAKHSTINDYSLAFPLNWGGNRIEAEIKSYEKGLFWKKEARKHDIVLEGKVFPHESGCACGGQPDDLPGAILSEIAEVSYHEEIMFPDAEGIYCKVDKPYEVILLDENEAKTYSFPQ